MRVVLIGGLTSILAALLVLGARVVTRARHAPSGVETTSEDDDAPTSQPPERGFSTFAPRLPSIVAPPCTPEPGHACVVGHLVLGAAVRERWARRCAESQDDENDDQDESSAESNAQTPEEEDDDDDSPGRDEDERGGGGGVAGRRRPALPPQAPFSDFFTVDARLLPRAGRGRATSPPANPAGPAPPAGVLREEPDAAATAHGTVRGDGTFVVQLAPGRYDLESFSHDQRLGGALRNLEVRAGEIHVDARIVLVETVSIKGRVLDDRGVAVDRRISVRHAEQPAGDEVASEFSSVPDGAFEVSGLLPGRYVVAALPSRGAAAPPPGRRDALASAASATVTAPVQGLTLIAPRALTGVILLGASAEDRCWGKHLRVFERDELGRPQVVTHVNSCVALVHEVTPDLPYVVVVTPVETGTTREVTFSGTPPRPICLVASCDDSVAVASLLVVDEDGVQLDDLVESHAELTSAGGGGAGDSDVGWMSTGLLEPQVVPAWRQFSGGATHRSGRRADTTLTLGPGYNEVVLRLGGYRVANERQDQARDPSPDDEGLVDDGVADGASVEGESLDVGDEDAHDRRAIVY